MVRLIDAENTMNKLLYGDAYIPEELAEYIKQVFDEQPTIEAEPVKHGKWVSFTKKVNGHDIVFVRCNCCNKERPFDYGLKYCHNCGARMDGDENA